MLSSSKVNELVRASNKLSLQQQHLIHAIESNSKEIAWNRKALQSMARTMQQFQTALDNLHIEINAIIASKYATSIINSLRDRMTAFKTAVMAASNGKLAPGLLTAEAAEHSLMRIKEMAEAKGLTLLIDDPKSLFAMPVSYVFSGLSLIHI